jgi:hypothetical protein
LSLTTWAVMAFLASFAIWRLCRISTRV